MTGCDMLDGSKVASMNRKSVGVFLFHLREGYLVVQTSDGINRAESPVFLQP